MIIDFLTSCASLIKVPQYTSINPNVLSNNYSVKTIGEIKSWKLANNAVSGASFTFFSSDVKKLKEIKLELGGSLNKDLINVKIETSLDHINWSELPYKEVTDTKYTYKVFNDTLFFDVKEKKLVTVPSTSLSYAFTTYNEYNKEYTYLYTNLEWKFIKVTLSNIPETEALGSVDNSLFFKTLEILIDEELNDKFLKTNLLELKASGFTQPKIFEEYEFFPDLIKNFMKMLEEKSVIPNTLNYVNVNLNLNPISESSMFRGIGHDRIGDTTVVYI